MPAPKERGYAVLPVCVCLFVRNKLLSQFPQQLLITEACNFSTLFIVACHMVGFIFVRIRSTSCFSVRDRLSLECISIFVAVSFATNHLRCLKF
jgi:hypothetical protein